MAEKIGETKIKTKTVLEVYRMLGNLIKSGLGDESIVVSIPYRNGIGVHYERVTNITIHDNMVDIHVTMPEYDDVKEEKWYEKSTPT